MYRRGALQIVGRTIAEVVAPDAWYLKRVDAQSLGAVLNGARIEAVGRLGKVLLLETSAACCGLRFGMTGRLVIDGRPVIDRLEYSAARFDPAWERFGLGFDDGGTLVMNDPRRLGGVVLNPDLSALGPDAWSISTEQLATAFADRRTALKALLLNQAKVAGLGNLLVDELLWRAAVSPERLAGEIDDAEVATIGAVLPVMLNELYRRGGSHCGDLFPERHVDGRCPDDGAPLSHGSIGGRSTWWCAEHQS